MAFFIERKKHQFHKTGTILLFYLKFSKMQRGLSNRFPPKSVGHFYKSYIV